MTKTYYLTDTVNTGLPGTAPSEYEISETSATQASVGPVEVANGFSRITRWWFFPGVQGAVNGQYTVEFNLTGAHNNLTADVHCIRYDSGGIPRDIVTVASGVSWGTAGLKTYQASGDLTAFGASDYFVVELKVTSDKQHGGAADYTIALNDANAQLITPWTEPPVTISGTGSRSKITSAVGQLTVHAAPATISGIGSRSKITSGVAQLTTKTFHLMLGDKPVKEIYLGDTQVTEVYLGDVQIFPPS